MADHESPGLAVCRTNPGWAQVTRVLARNSQLFIPGEALPLKQLDDQVQISLRTSSKSWICRFPEKELELETPRARLARSIEDQFN